MTHPKPTQPWHPKMLSECRDAERDYGHDICPGALSGMRGYGMHYPDYLCSCPCHYSCKCEEHQALRRTQKMIDQIGDFEYNRDKEDGR